ncbi:MAG: LysR substrate-binding domain-containing protein [Kiloniellales bacterium]
MRYRQIEAFRYVMISGSATGAAEALAVTQPAISRLIADLEADLGFKLFERHKGRLLPTPDALRFYQGVEQYFQGFERLDRIAKQIRTQSHADLRVCATPALSTFLFPTIVQRFRERHPDIHLSIESLSSSEVVSRLRGHMADLAVTLAFPEVAGIAQETLLEAAHVCAFHESHPLAAHEIITPEHFAGEEVISILPSGQVNWNKVEQVLKEAGVECRRGIGIQNSHTGYSLVAAKLAIALIEPFAARTWLKHGVVVRPFRPEVTFRYVIATPLSSRPTEQVAAFAGMIKDFIREQAGCLTGETPGVVGKQTRAKTIVVTDNSIRSEFAPARKTMT